MSEVSNQTEVPKEKAGEAVIVGLTGGIATGKSTVTRMLREMGAYVVDADVWARKIVEPGMPALKELVLTFGEDVLLPNGELNRPKLGSIVFHSPEARVQLNEITHPRVREGMKQETEAYLQTNPDKPIVWDVPLLFEGETRQLVDVTLLVYADEATQKARLLHRDQLSEADAVARMNAQMPIEQKRELADYLIDNRGSLDETRRQVEAVWNILWQRSAGA